MTDDLPFRFYAPADELMALAQMLKRMSFDDCERLANKRSFYGLRLERDVMWGAVQALQRQLAEAGFSPR
jgi:hypothetical protein